MRKKDKKFDLYVHDSPILDLYFYLDSKYGFSELEISEEEIRRIFMKKLPLHAEDFFRNLLAKIDLKSGKIVEKDIMLILFYIHLKK
ncbi:MAG: hypothetical protein QW806_00215 [Nitrososphaerota archaeon]